MRWLVAAVLLAGCDKLLGLTPLHAPDAPTPPDAPPGYVYAAYSDFTHGYQMSVVSLPIVPPSSPPPPSVNLLIATLALSWKPTYSPFVVSSITYQGASLTPLATVTGVNVGDPYSLTAQYMLVDPPSGSGELIATIMQVAPAVHLGAVFFGGVDTTMPVYSMMTDKEFSASSTLLLKTQPGQLVESFTGQGHGIMPPVMPATEIYLDGDGVMYSLDNTAALTTPATATGAATTVAWAYTGADENQTIAAALVPAPP